MKVKMPTVHIIGGGISGLIAAINLEKEGLSPIIIEATERVGGRLKTDIIDNYQLDRGFQVLLTAYPAAKKYLDLEALELQKLLPGASIFKDQKQKLIGDPLRDFSLLFPTLFSGIGTLQDKFKVLKLNTKLKHKSISEIFDSEELTTLNYLKNFGFSNSIINEFFRPFFSGIFLEDKLETSSRMFEFIYKMFGKGLATIPKTGIEAIPKQLKAKLTKSTFLFNTKVKTISGNEISLENGEKIESDYIIIATASDQLLSTNKVKPTLWKSCDNLYFECEKRNIEKPLIGLSSSKASLINNLFYPSSIETKTSGKNELLSVTVVNRQNLSDEGLIQRVTKELEEDFKIKAKRLLTHYKIPLALPNLTTLKYETTARKTKISKHIYLAGDTLLNGSLNAAILSGENVVSDVIHNIKQN